MESLGRARGNLWVVIAGPDEPVCVIEITEVRIFPYDEVPDEYAWEGGEGDRTVRDWRRMCWKYILSECKRIGFTPIRSKDGKPLVERSIWPRPE